MTNPVGLFQQGALVAQRLIADGAKILGDAADKMDPEKPNDYTPADLVATMTELAKLPVRGGREIAERARGAVDDPTSDEQKVSLLTGPAVIADHVSTVVENTIEQYGRVAHGAAEQMQDGKRFPDIWMEMFTKLVDISVVNGVEVLQTAFIGPAPYARTTFRSPTLRASEKVNRVRTLSIAEPFKRAGTDEGPIRNDRIRFDPPALPADADEFTLVVHEENLPSSIYLGIVRINDPEGTSEDIKVTLRM